MYFETKIEIVLKTENVFWTVSDMQPLKNFFLNRFVSWCFQLVWFIVSFGSSLRFVILRYNILLVLSYWKVPSFFANWVWRKERRFWIFSTIGCKTEPLINDPFIRISALSGCSEKLYHVLWGKVILSQTWTSSKNYVKSQPIRKYYFLVAVVAVVVDVVDNDVVVISLVDLKRQQHLTTQCILPIQCF